MEGPRGSGTGRPRRTGGAVRKNARVRPGGTPAGTGTAQGRPKYERSSEKGRRAARLGRLGGRMRISILTIELRCGERDRRIGRSGGVVRRRGGVVSWGRAARAA